MSLPIGIVLPQGERKEIRVWTDACRAAGRKERERGKRMSNYSDRENWYEPLQDEKPATAQTRERDGAEPAAAGTEKREKRRRCRAWGWWIAAALLLLLIVGSSLLFGGGEQGDLSIPAPWLSGRAESDAVTAPRYLPSRIVPRETGLARSG